MQSSFKLLGLIGYPLEHSFSERYFNQRISQLGYDFVEYRNFPLEEIEDLQELLSLFPEICGFNVTSPYKQQVIRYLTEISEDAQKIGAVNTVIVQRQDEQIQLKGFNTDVDGFRAAIEPLLEPHHKSALILGTGGAAQAVAYVLRQLGIKFSFVSRSKRLEHPTYIYNELTRDIVQQNLIVINTTPLGMYPKVHFYPPFPYQYLTDKHLLFDLIYNPAETKFLEFGRLHGAKVSNGLQMLYKQADKAWEIFEQYGCFRPE